MHLHRYLVQPFCLQSALLLHVFEVHPVLILQSLLHESFFGLRSDVRLVQHSDVTLGVGDGDGLLQVFDVYEDLVRTVNHLVFVQD